MDINIFEKIYSSLNKGNENIRASLAKIKSILADETRESNEMLKIYQKYVTNNENITKEEADAIGRGITAALLNKNYLTKEEIGNHRSQINKLANNNNDRNLHEKIQLLKIQLNEKERRIEELYNQLKFKKK